VHFPPLLNAANPRGQRWSDVQLNRKEVDQLFRGLVMIVGFNDRTGLSEVLGSGFLVGVLPHLLVLTATHVITEWADKVRPPAHNSFAALHGDTDIRRRVQELINANLIRAIAHCSPETYRLCKIASISITADPRVTDVSCLRLVLPANTKPQDFGAIRIDADPYPWEEPVLMVGFTHGSRWTPPAIEDEPFDITQNMSVRVGCCRGVVEKPRGMTYPMFQLNIPSLPGMSGGPILALRYPNGRPRVISSVPSVHATAIGVVSREYTTEPYLVDGSDPGETLAAPIEDAFYLKLAFSRGENLYFAEAVQRGMIESYGSRASTATVKAGELPGQVAIRFAQAAPTRWNY
jgi:hypothetical protein